MPKCTVLAALFFGLFSIGQVVAQTPTPRTLVRAGRMLDPRRGDVLSPAAVLIENGKIKEVGSPTQVQARAPGVKTIDLGSSTLLPGLD
jgi:imidazolonepropionase-like amidohydrolase